MPDARLPWWTLVVGVFLGSCAGNESPAPSPAPEVAAGGQTLELTGRDLEIARHLARMEELRFPTIREGDPNAAVAREEKERLEQVPPGSWITRTVSPARRIASDALDRLLPGHGFLLLAWQDRPVDPEQHPVHIALGLHLIVSVAPDGTRMRHFSGDESFAALLAHAGVEIRTEEQARLVLKAHSDLFGRSWTLPCEMVSPTVWRLGVQDSGDRRYWYEVLLDGDGKVVSGGLRSKPSVR